MATKTRKHRGGGKKNTLFPIDYVTYRLVDNYEEQVEAGKALAARFNNMNLKAYLAKVEKVAKVILKTHDLPTTWREILPYTNNYDLPINASYAADILFTIHEVREFIKKGDATNAAYVAIRLGGYIACNDAEVEYGGRNFGKTVKGRGKLAEKPKARREQMAAIAKEKFKWQPGMTLTGPQRRAVNAALMRKYKLSDRPSSQDMSNDALILGFRTKKK